MSLAGSDRPEKRDAEQPKLFREPREPLFQGSRGWKGDVLNRVQLPPAPKRTSHRSMRAVLGALDDHARNKPTCHPSEKRLCQCTGLSESALRRALRALEAVQVIEITPRNTHRGRASSVYLIRWDRLASLVPGMEWQSPPVTVPSPPVTVPSPPVTVPGDLNRLSNRLSNRLPLQSPDLQSCEFDPWAEAEEALIALGIGEHAAAIAAIRSNGCGPEFVLSAVELYRSRPGWWFSPGAVLQRLKLARPNQDPRALTFWPRPVPAAKERFDRTLAVERSRPEKELEATRREESNAKIRSQLDRLAQLPSEELRGLIERTFAGSWLLPLCLKTLETRSVSGLGAYSHKLVETLEREGGQP